MQNKPSVHYLFLINKKSGANDGPEWEAVLQEKFTNVSLTYQILYLPATFEPEDINRQVKEINPAVLVAAGGDGTVALAASIVAHSSIILGIIPQGSANGMAKELGIPADVEQALDILLQHNPSACDLIKIDNMGYCVHLADAGLNARLIKYFDEGNGRGMLGYAKVVLKSMIRQRKITLQLTTDEGTVTRAAFMVVFANASKYGTGAVINPEGVVHDGYFEVVVVKRLNFGALLGMLIKPGLFNPEKIEIFKVKNVQISAKHAMHFQVDGEYKGRLKKVEASIEPSALQVLVGDKEVKTK